MRESTRDDLRRMLGIDPGRVDVVPLGLGVSRAQALPEATVRARLGEHKRPLVLTVSALRPHKNLMGLIDAMALIAPERRPLLVIVGYPTDHEADLRREIDTLGIAADVRILGWVDSETLEGLYAIARAFVFPSLYEGFGLPVLEAMARDLPVACSGQGSLREVAGSAALTFDPHSPAEIAAALERLVAGGPDVEKLRRAGAGAGRPGSRGRRPRAPPWPPTAGASALSRRRLFSPGASR